MIKFTQGKVTHIPKDYIKSLEQANPNVDPQALWVAYDIHLDDIHSLYYGDVEVSYNTDEVRTKALLGQLDDETNDYYVLAARGVSYNTLYAASTLEQSELKVLPSTVLGYSDQVYRVKYVATPVESFWGYDGVPIVITKRRAKR